MAESLKEFEASMQGLEAILEKMEDEALPLEESIALYAKAAGLIEVCSKGLQQAQVQVQEIDEKLQPFLAEDAE
ncbi:exodeoxyribonuclease VII small subunit [Ruminococcaceae bacterium OttesenSCG-928-O06]|nr:exodeoxyribonuclease VII small subunit [Ruminococcaceae bacterium OttesenSCG-928-O06]